MTWDFYRVTDDVDDNLAAYHNELIDGLQQFHGPRGFLINGYIAPSVSTNNLVAAIKTLAGNDPSSTDPVGVRIGDTVRTITGALSVTVAAGVNTFNLGSAELGTLEQDLFVYLIWNTTPTTDAVDIGLSRIPYGEIYSDFSSTATDEKYMAVGSSDTPVAGDDCVNIGRFAATLSLTGTGHLWTVPPFTSKNLIQRPIFETRWLNWTPAWSCSGSMTIAIDTDSLHRYKIRGDEVHALIRVSATLGGTQSTDINVTLPFDAVAPFLSNTGGWGNIANNGSPEAGQVLLVPGTPDTLRLRRTSTTNFTLAANTVPAVGVIYGIDAT